MRRHFEASTVGLAYSQDPDGTTAGTDVAGLANAETQMAPVGSDGAFVDDYESLTDMPPVDGERKPFLLVGSALTSIFVVGVVALVISLAVSIRPTVDERPSPGPERPRSQHGRPGGTGTCARSAADRDASCAAGADHQAPGPRGAGSSAGAAADRLCRVTATGASGGPGSCARCARART